MAFQLSRVPQTDDELYWYVRVRFGVAVPRTRVCAGHVSPFEAFADAFFARNSLDPASDQQSLALWHGSRGLSGKSYTLSLLAVTMAELLGADVNLLGGSLAQSMNIHEHVGMAMRHDNAPEYMVVDASTSRISLTNGARIRPLTASQKTVRGPHPPRLLLDEIDEMDLKILDAALGQPMPQPNYLNEIITPYTVMCSTWQNPQGTFTEVQRRAEERGYPIYQWCFRESANPIDGWLSEDTIAEKKNSISKAMWEAEYELNEPSIGTRAFDTNAVERMFSLPFSPLAQKESKDFEEYLFEKPERHGRYVCAADWGKEKDYTVITVARIDTYPRRVVYYMKVNRRPWPLMMGWFNKAAERYHAQSIHDATGLGDVIEDYVDHRAIGFKMIGAERADMLTEYVNAVEAGAWHVPKIKSAWSAHRYCQVQDLYSSSKEFHLPDEVCSFALAEHVARTVAPLAAPQAVKKDSAPTARDMTHVPAESDTATPGRFGDVSVKRWDDPAEMSLTV
jgi:hypothetical protein